MSCRSEFAEEGGMRVNGGMDQEQAEQPLGRPEKLDRKRPLSERLPFTRLLYNHGTAMLGLHRRTGLGGGAFPTCPRA